MKRKGIILAGGSGTRLYPCTQVISKQLLPIYDKPMIYYPLSVLMLANVQEILLISTPHDISLFQKLLGNGSHWGIQVEYAVQEKPEGLAQAMIIGENFLNGSPSILILGDNIFYGHNLNTLLDKANQNQEGANIFAYHVQDPERYGVVEFNKNKQVISIEEKPKEPKSNYAVTGLYFYDHKASEYAKALKPSSRGELEITDLNKIYLAKQKLSVIEMQRGYAWLDTGTHESLLEAQHFIHTIEKRQGLKVACLEEIAFHKKWISAKELESLAKFMKKNEYGTYLSQIIQEN